MRRADGPRRPPPWLFGVPSISYGSFNGLIAVALPYVLRRRGLTVEQITVIAAVVQMPAIWYFLWAPMVDVGLRRRTWVALLAFASAVCAAIAVGRATASVRVLTVLLVAASVFNQPVSSAIGGLIASVMPDRVRGRTSGWSQVGILGGGVVTGGIAIWLTQRSSALTTALVLAGIIGLPAFAALLVDEPARIDGGARTHLARMWADVVAMLKRREVWLALLFFFSPAGAGALLNLFSAVSPDFHASAGDVIRVVGIAGALTPAGALIGGFLCDRYNRWRVYPFAGIAAAASVAPVAFLPLTPMTYLVIAAGYALATGVCYASSMALALQVVGAPTAATGTRFTLFMAAVNVPVVYMLRLDGLSHARFGVRGMLAADAIANVVAALILLSPFVRARTRRAPPPIPS